MTHKIMRETAQLDLVHGNSQYNILSFNRYIHIRISKITMFHTLYRRVKSTLLLIGQKTKDESTWNSRLIILESNRNMDKFLSRVMPLNRIVSAYVCVFIKVFEMMILQPIKMPYHTK